MKILLFAVAVGITASASLTAGESEQLKPGTYKGSLDDEGNSTFTVVIVSEKGQPRVRQVGYKFVATGIEVQNVSRKDGGAFGKVREGKLTFEIPVLAGFSPSPSLLSVGGTVTFANFAVELSGSKDGQIECFLKQIDELSDDYKLGDFAMSNVGFGPGKWGLEKEYKVTLKPEKTPAK